MRCHASRLTSFESNKDATTTRGGSKGIGNLLGFADFLTTTVATEQTIGFRNCGSVVLLVGGAIEVNFERQFLWRVLFRDAVHTFNHILGQFHHSSCRNMTSTNSGDFLVCGRSFFGGFRIILFLERHCNLVKGFKNGILLWVVSAVLVQLKQAPRCLYSGSATSKPTGDFVEGAATIVRGRRRVGNNQLGWLNHVLFDLQNG